MFLYLFISAGYLRSAASLAHRNGVSACGSTRPHIDDPAPVHQPASGNEDTTQVRTDTACKLFSDIYLPPNNG